MQFSASPACARVFGAIAGLVLAGACSDVTPFAVQPVTRYGSVSFVGRKAVGDLVSATTYFTFLRGYATVPNSATLATDACVPSAVDNLAPIVRGQFAAGDTIRVRIGAQQSRLAYRVTESRYETSDAAPITYRSGDLAQIEVPGSDTAFPAATISLKLAEPLLPGAVAAPARTGDPLTITWNATNDPTSVILLYLRYGVTSSATAATEQLACRLRDDGSLTIPYATLSTFLASSVSTRSLWMIRYRTNALQIDDHTILHAASQVDTIIANIR